MKRLFVVGTAKAGTTSLHLYLDQHPGIFMSRPKEPLVLARPVMDLPDGVHPDHVVRSERAYADLFAAARPDQVLGESSTAYLASALASERISARWPDSVIVAILRDPADRAFSEFTMRVEAGAESLTDFDAALDAALRGERAYLRRSRYADDIRRWRDAFGPDNTMFVLFEDFVADPQAVLADVIERVGADPAFAFDVGGRHNTAEGRARAGSPVAARSPAGLAARRLARRLTPPELQRSLRRRRSARLRRSLPRCTSGQRSRVIGHCLDDIEEVERLLGVDLARWRTA